MKRKDIQALRGFAVLAVLLFHLQIAGFRGGFLGVDIFFVISGFVITDRLARGTGSVKRQILDFYRRRAKRILPASLLVIVLTAILARFFLAPLALRRLGLDGLATTFFAGNIRFAAQGNNYLTQSMSPTPYLHYWSLGVEEQFYLIWPILFLLFFSARKALLVPFFLLTTAGAFWYTQVAAVNSFYLPISRAWEFVAGILVALVIPPIPHESRAAKGIAMAGWLAVTASIIVIGSDFPVPGVSTLLPVAGAVAIITTRSSFFWQPVLGWFGDNSFSIYLIHWPLVVVALSRYQGLSTTAKFAIATASILVGYAITSVVEVPFRFNSHFTVGFVGWGVALTTAAVLVFATTSFLPASAQSSKFAFDLTEPVIYKNGCHLNFGVSQPTAPCVFGDLGSKVEVVLTGDSHAAQWFTALQILALQNHWKLLSLTKSSCPAALLATKRNGLVDASCAQWQKYVAARIAREAPAKVFLTSFTEYTYPLMASGGYAARYTNGTTNFIKAIGAPVASIYYIEDTPRPKQSIPDCLSKHLRLPTFCDFGFQRSAATVATQRAVVALGVHDLSINDLLCPKSKCSAIYSGHNTYRDASHLSVSAVTTLAPSLSPLIR